MIAHFELKRDDGVILWECVLNPMNYMQVTIPALRIDETNALIGFIYSPNVVIIPAIPSEAENKK